MNGLAAIHLIHSEKLEAIDMYNKVLSLNEKNSASFQIDSLQKLHTLHNLVVVADSVQTSEGFPMKVDTSGLRTQADQVRADYLRESRYSLPLQFLTN
jgi:hypothetical protein